MDSADYFPVLVMPGIPDGEDIIFNSIEEKIIVSDDSGIIWEILAKCNGYNSITSIVKLTRTDLKEHAENILLDLIDIGIIVDSRHLYAHFHKITSNPPSYNSSFSFEEIRKQVEKRDDEIGSEVPALENSYMQGLVFNRHSCRSFSQSHKISHNDLRRILQLSCSIPNHAFPSAGSLYPLDFRVIVASPGKGLKSGIYKFEISGLLTRIDLPYASEMFGYAFDSDSLLFGASAIIVVSADLNMHPRKYSNRGYRYTLLEAGHAAQNIHLASMEAKMNTLEYGGFNDSVLKSLIGLNQNQEPIIAIAIGKQSKHEAFNPYLLLEKLNYSYVGKNKPVNKVFMTSLGNNEHNEYFVSALAHFKPAKYQDAKKSYRERYSAGTARSNNLAMIKAIAEGYERYCSGEFRFDIETKANMLGVEWVDPRIYTPYSNMQLSSACHLTKFTENKTMHWVEGKNLKAANAVWVPSDLVFYPISASALGRRLIYESNSSGVAAHTTYDKAIEGALLELVERDAIMRSWLLKEAPKRLKQSSLPPFILSRCEYWESKGRQVHVLDHSHNGISIVNVCIVSKDEHPAFVNGSSASISSTEEALNKAFQEAELGLIMELNSKTRSKHLKPEDVYSPTDHAKYYFPRERLENLLWLFSGEYTETSISHVGLEGVIEMYDPVMVDLTLEDPLLKVVRVLSSKLIPINFGNKNEHYTHSSLNRKVSYKELSHPHYFA